MANNLAICWRSFIINASLKGLRLKIRKNTILADLRPDVLFARAIFLLCLSAVPLSPA
ncbi:hypothetical protein KCP73_24400 [Salmonella enterica subsp. enterica]|nr:hypothetical protein KCP73_24400 [Salmonella enterica subsp. enterica]